MKWKPANWKTLDKAERKTLREKHQAPKRAKRQEFWAKVWGRIDPLVKRAAVELAGEAGDDRREWVVDQVQAAADKLATAPGMAGIAFEAATDSIIYSEWFEGLIDTQVQNAFDRLRAAGEA